MEYCKLLDILRLRSLIRNFESGNMANNVIRFSNLILLTNCSYCPIVFQVYVHDFETSNQSLLHFFC